MVLINRVTGKVEHRLPAREWGKVVHGVGVVLSRKNAAWFGLIAIVAWTVTEIFALSFRSIAVVLSLTGVLWLIVIWRELRNTPRF